MNRRHAIPSGLRGLLVAVWILAAIPALAQSEHEDESIAQGGAAEVVSPGHEVPAAPVPPTPAPAAPTPAPGAPAPAPAATLPAATPPSPRSATTTHQPSQATVPTGEADAPKRLGRQFPAPVQPPPPAETPEVHITVVPPSEPRVGKSRLRQGGGNGGGTLQDSDHGGADDGGLGDGDGE